MKFFKDNSSDIGKLFIDQIGINIFAIFLFTAVGMIKDNYPLFNKLRILVSVFALVFYLFIIYTVIWEIGAKDKIRIDGGRLEPQKNKGLLMGLFANIPNFAFSIITFAVILISSFTSPEEVSSISFTFMMILKLLEGLYMGISQGIANAISPIVVDESAYISSYPNMMIECGLYIVLPILVIITTHIAYTMGSKDKKIFNFKKTKKQ